MRKIVKFHQKHSMQIKPTRRQPYFNYQILFLRQCPALAKELTAGRSYIDQAEKFHKSFKNLKHRHVFWTYPFTSSFLPRSLTYRNIQLCVFKKWIFKRGKDKTKMASSNTLKRKKKKHGKWIEYTSIISIEYRTAFRYYIKNYRFWDSPSGPVANTPCSQCRGPGFNLWSGN